MSLRYYELQMFSASLLQERSQLRHRSLRASQVYRDDVITINTTQKSSTCQLSILHPASDVSTSVCPHESSTMSDINSGSNYRTNNDRDGGVWDD